MDRSTFSKSFTVSDVPPWRCPSCADGHLTLQEERLLKRQTAASLEEQKIWESEPSWIEYRAAVIFVCSRCGEAVVCACDGRVDVHDYYDEFGEHQQDVSEVFTPKFFDPPLSLLDIPEDCPEAVAGHLQTSFSLYFNNPSASANSARIALEHLMGSLGVPKISQNDSLHSRIGRLAPPYDEVKELLLAAKWLGNDGSHGGDLTKAEVNILYDVLELALHETFDKTKETIRAKARAINAARKKP